MSASPEVRYPNVYGINISTHNELVAHNRSADEVATFIKADWVLFQDLEDLEDCVRELNPALKEFENSVFSGCYVTCDDEESVATSSEQGSPRPGAKTPLSRVSPALLNNPLAVVARSSPYWHTRFRYSRHRFFGAAARRAARSRSPSGGTAAPSGGAGRSFH